MVEVQAVRRPVAGLQAGRREEWSQVEVLPVARRQEAVAPRLAERQEERLREATQEA